jgi:pimeloyl-ACP methyl ester carboxylesterase
VYQKIKLLDHLPAHFTCIVFDRRECGQSGGRVEPITWSHYVAQGKGLLDHLHIARAHLMGGCMGCAPVAAFAVAHPDMVASLVLYWPVGGAKCRMPMPESIATTPITMGIFLWSHFPKSGHVNIKSTEQRAGIVGGHLLGPEQALQFCAPRSGPGSYNRERLAIVCASPC